MIAFFHLLLFHVCSSSSSYFPFHIFLSLRCSKYQRTERSLEYDSLFSSYVFPRLFSLLFVFPLPYLSSFLRCSKYYHRTERRLEYDFFFLVTVSTAVLTPVRISTSISFLLPSAAPNITGHDEIRAGTEARGRKEGKNTHEHRVELEGAGRGKE